MIMPGLLTASTSNADHLGISGDGLFVLAPLSLLLCCRRFLVFKRVFPPRRDRWLRLAPQSTPVGPQRSGGVADLCYVAGVDNVNGEGELNLASLVISRRGCDYTREDATVYRRECD
jgi:hypothetical protein